MIAGKMEHKLRYQWLTKFLMFFHLVSSYLSKGSSDLKENGTKEKKPFSGPNLHFLSHGVIRFVAIVSLKSSEIEVSY